MRTKIITTKQGRKVEVDVSDEACRQYGPGYLSGNWIATKGGFSGREVRRGVIQGVGPCGEGSYRQVLWLLFDGEKTCVFLPQDQ